MSETKIIVLDDDPTGSQTVHGCLLLTQWDVATLEHALTDASPLFFVLTNSRALAPDRARDVVREVCRNLKQALAGHDIDPILVSRSDSTLRGHYPLETDVIAEELGPFDAHFLVPAFIEGGRITRDSTHYLRIEGSEVPVHETEFARDSVFAYRHSYLPDYVEEKTAGRIPAQAVERLRLTDIRAGTQRQLAGYEGNVCVVVDAETQADLTRFAADVRGATAEGKRFLFRSGASLLTALAALPRQPVSAENMGLFNRTGKPGAIVVGSHVPKTTRQLNALLAQDHVAPIEVDIGRLPEDYAAIATEVCARAARAHERGQTPVIFTSREERQFADPHSRLLFGEQVSRLLMDIVRDLPASIGFLISKGGITSNDVLSQALDLPSVRLLGQILPGVSVVRCPHDHPRFPGLPVVIFPGNVGDDEALAVTLKRLQKGIEIADARP